MPLYKEKIGDRQSAGAGGRLVALMLGKEFILSNSIKKSSPPKRAKKPLLTFETPQYLMIRLFAHPLYRHPAFLQ